MADRAQQRHLPGFSLAQTPDLRGLRKSEPFQKLSLQIAIPTRKKITVKVEEQREELCSSARTLLSQAYLSGLDYNAVLKILKDADREITLGRKKEAS